LFGQRRERCVCSIGKVPLGLLPDGVGSLRSVPRTGKGWHLGSVSLVHSYLVAPDRSDLLAFREAFLADAVRRVFAGAHRLLALPERDHNLLAALTVGESQD